MRLAQAGPWVHPWQPEGLSAADQSPERNRVTQTLHLYAWSRRAFLVGLMEKMPLGSRGVARRTAGVGEGAPHADAAVLFINVPEDVKI